ncbi:MAG: peptidoglycan DD-metalloendopeptidase family protein [Daejeonella sp.]|uniref:murein hydrolase activator EnvC family protein n=1 Tax=Daejeonella sp. TaxID=2805397 RepID=UPI0027331BFE|nr:peptidoglycan DD-metalloendopeptidase family protein [Daejeonella sp.]MDP3469893.1 peptidoglycan DD-metalloendopeptidase family protein [Daejeonella sp.]
MRLLKSIAILALMISLNYSAFGQSSSVLKKRKEAITREIEELKISRNKIDKNKKLSLNQINLLNTEIRLREDKIRTINTEIKILDTKIISNNSKVISLQTNLNKLKSQYSKMIVFAFRNQGAYNKLMFIFASNNFNQAYMRLRYIQQVGTFRKRQAKEITSTQLNLKKQIIELDQYKIEKTNLLMDQIVEKQTLGKDKEQQSKILTGLTKKQKELQQQLSRKQKEANTLNKAIQETIRKEILTAQRKEAERRRLAAAAEAASRAKNNTGKSKSAKPIASGSSILASSPEDAKLSSSFLGSRGRMQKPAQGIITQGFGQQKFNNVTIFNPGINIKTTVGTIVYAVYGGKVSKVIYLVNSYTIIIRHGEYFSIYSKLKNSSVAAGQEVTARQSIGVVATDPNEDLTEMQFQIWKGGTPVNPSGWISQ